MVIHVKTRICDEDLRVVFYRYSQGGRLAIELHTMDGEPYYTATVNIAEAPLAEGHVLLKGWSENEGLPEALETAGLVKLTGRSVASGYVAAQEARLLCAIPENL